MLTKDQPTVKITWEAYEWTYPGTANLVAKAFRGEIKYSEAFKWSVLTKEGWVHDAGHEVSRKVLQVIMGRDFACKQSQQLAGLTNKEIKDAIEKMLLKANGTAFNKTYEIMRHLQDHPDVHVSPEWFEEHDTSEVDDFSVGDNFLDNPQEVEWIFKDLFAYGSIGIMAADTGVGKSLFRNSLVASAISGKPLIPAFAPSKPLRVLVLAGEEPESAYQSRWKGCANAFGLDHDAQTRHYYYPQEKIEPLISKRGGQLAPTDFFRKVKKVIAQQNIDLLVVDPVRSFLSGASENDNSEVGEFINQLRRLGRSVLLVHHYNKSANGSSKKSVSGAGQFTTSAQLVMLGETFSVSRVKKGLTIKIDKVSYSSKWEGDSQRFYLRDGCAIPSGKDRLEDEAMALLDWVMNHPENKVTESSFKRGSKSRADQNDDNKALTQHLKTSCGVNSAEGRGAALNEAINRRLVQFSGGGLRPLLVADANLILHQDREISVNRSN